MDCPCQQQVEHQPNRNLLPPLPVIRERAGVRVISNVEQHPTAEITLTVSLSRVPGERTRNRSPQIRVTPATAPTAPRPGFDRAVPYLLLEAGIGAENPYGAR
jgi:hypothetical protein